MGLKFEDSAPKAVTEEDIIVCGKKVGTMKIYPPANYSPRTRYHAAIQTDAGIIGLIQGHGDTKEEAVANAVENGRRNATTLLEKINEFQLLLAIDEEPAITEEA